MKLTVKSVGLFYDILFGEHVFITNGYVRYKSVQSINQSNTNGRVPVFLLWYDVVMTSPYDVSPVRNIMAECSPASL
jgi:hypothetical protein